MDNPATIYELTSSDPKYVCSIIIQEKSYIVRNYGTNGVYLYCTYDAPYKWYKLIRIDDVELTIKKNNVFYTFMYSFHDHVHDESALKNKIIAAVYPNGSIHTSPTEGLRF